jgi:hypothetical protein
MVNGLDRFREHFAAIQVDGVLAALARFYQMNSSQ